MGVTDPSAVQRDPPPQYSSPCRPGRTAAGLASRLVETQPGKEDTGTGGDQHGGASINITGERLSGTRILREFAEFRGILLNVA